MTKTSSSRLLSVNLAMETDFLLARQRAKQIAEILGFENQDQTRISTAVSEIARNAYEYAQGGVVEYHYDRVEDYEGDRAAYRIVVKDKGRGIAELQAIWDGSYISASGMGVGISGSRRLMDDLEIDSTDSGTTVTMRKFLPSTLTPLSPEALAQALGKLSLHDLGAAVHTQNHEMIRLLNDLRDRDRELQQLNQELKETNRGVMVLYSELEDRALELQHASEMKTRFISGITHELRTPLNSIVSLTGLLIRRIDGELTAEQEKQVLFIQRSAQNLTEMVNDLLDLAKIEAGKVATRLTEFTIAELLAALRGMFRPLATNENVRLIFEERGLEGTRLHTDEGKLSQILRNFISNALKFTHRGEVRVRTTLVGGTGVRFSVMDTGVGIAKENQELVWQEWGQVEGDQRARHKGSGLGLPLARQLATLLGGTTWMESEQGRGSTFYVEIPAIAIAAAEAEPQPAVESTILIVDDDEVARYILRRNLLALTSATLVEVASIAEARAAIHAQRPGIVFLDVVLPGGNGLEYAMELREASETRDLPVAIVSSKVLTADERAMLDREGLGYIDKEQGDNQDQRMFLERVLMNHGLCDLHLKGGSE